MLREEEEARLERQQVLLTQIVWLCLRPDKAAGKQCRLLLPRLTLVPRHQLATTLSPCQANMRRLFVCAKKMK